MQVWVLATGLELLRRAPIGRKSQGGRIRISFILLSKLNEKNSFLAFDVVNGHF